jgi:hypothetical protein
MAARVFDTGLRRDFFPQFTTKTISVVKNMYGEQALYGGTPGEQALV